MTAHVLGIDFGTLSARVLVVSAADGAELACVEHPYRNGVIDRALPGSRAELPPLWALQDPRDWLSVLREAVPEAVARAGIDPATVAGVGTDFTASTPLPVLADGTPLCVLDGFAERPHAWPKLWKHHAAQAQADRITGLAQASEQPWLSRYGGRISAEWQLAKALQILEEDPEVWEATARWIEAADWIVWQLTGRETRNPCTAGYKGLYQDGRYPDEDYLAALHPRFADVYRTRVAHPLTALGSSAGGLSARAAAWTGLPEGTPVAVGNVDAHVTAAAAQTYGNGQLLAIMGTSTCHMMNSDVLREVPGACGVVEGGIVAGSFGYEAGQSGVGDIFAWWVDNAVPERYHEPGRGVHEVLGELAARQRVGEHGLLALDWMGGNRSVLVDHELSGALLGMTLSTTVVDIYRALLESTAFGTRVIVDTFENAGLPVTEFVAAGGLVRNPLLMQIYADVTGLPMSVVDSAQAPALGSAVHAAVAAGIHPEVRTASAAMGRRHHAAYLPIPEHQRVYQQLYQEYVRLHDHFGRGGNDVLHRLHALKTRSP
ncbi:ribulokinase [Streptomyces pseudovenezuelae]|uniref:Ribulokinase n=1 Tax=Streptomyces pseudovenezuelae TaxID=67350 RepID=A0ABT6LCG6_9ACTN|nr:ribulokinase [Streptomyces pseudovenezuelae]MDH6213998.1 L-ribulokinase [Streptomyces pseudovenezuelae]